jgi:hypothetical protein
MPCPRRVQGMTISCEGCKRNSASNLAPVVTSKSQLGVETILYIHQILHGKGVNKMVVMWEANS